VIRLRALLPALLFLAACGRKPVEGGPTTPVDHYIAFAKDFDGYPSWEAHKLESNIEPNDVHAGGERTLYLSRRPPSGSTRFPVGTLIVKALPGVGRVFARVKRGGDYNSDNPGWEWFELQHTGPETVIIVWRGIGPPSGEGYGGDPNGCNGCHAGFADNDYVGAPDLALSGF